MNKYFKLAIIGLLLASSSAMASFTTTATVVAGGVANLLTLVNGSAKVSSVTIQANTTNNATITLFDSPTNVWTYVNPAYTNRSVYATNLIQGPFTNYYGATNYLTNLDLITVTNNVIAASTNTYNSFGFSATTNTAVTYSSLNLYFDHGLWLTNTGTGTVVFTIVYVQ